MDELTQLASKADVLRQKIDKKRKVLGRHRALDEMMCAAHERAFSQINCLDCANCCQTTSPRFTNADISNLARHLGQKPRQFAAQYLRRDEDGDQVLQSTPCPFLAEDRSCNVYDLRPKACKGYPHTNRSRQRKILDLTLQNASICPAVTQILTEVLSQIDKR